MTPIYLYLSIYNYGYAATSYDIIVAPFLNFFVDYHNGLTELVAEERNRIRAL